MRIKTYLLRALLSLVLLITLYSCKGKIYQNYYFNEDHSGRYEFIKETMSFDEVINDSIEYTIKHGPLLKKEIYLGFLSQFGSDIPVFSDSDFKILEDITVKTEEVKGKDDAKESKETYQLTFDDLADLYKKQSLGFLSQEIMFDILKLKKDSLKIEKNFRSFSAKKDSLLSPKSVKNRPFRFKGSRFYGIQQINSQKEDGAWYNEVTFNFATKVKIVKGLQCKLSEDQKSVILYDTLRLKKDESPWENEIVLKILNKKAK